MSGCLVFNTQLHFLPPIPLQMESGRHCLKKCTASVLVMSYNARNGGENLDAEESTEKRGTRSLPARHPLPCGGAGRGEGARPGSAK